MKKENNMQMDIASLIMPLEDELLIFHSHEIEKIKAAILSVAPDATFTTAYIIRHPFSGINGLNGESKRFINIIWRPTSQHIMLYSLNISIDESLENTLEKLKVDIQKALRIGKEVNHDEA